MSVTYEDLKKANDTIKTTDIKGKAYSEVPQRIKAFRMVYPEGFIHTDRIEDLGGVCVFRAEVGFFDENGFKRILGTGTAFERQDANFINKTSYIENCETSAVGRALGMCGFGIDVSVASAEEVQNAINIQSEQTEKTEPQEVKKATPKQVEYLLKFYKGEDLEKLLNANNLQKIEDISVTKASELISKLGGKKKG